KPFPAGAVSGWVRGEVGTRRRRGHGAGGHAGGTAPAAWRGRKRARERRGNRRPQRRNTYAKRTPSSPVGHPRESNRNGQPQTRIAPIFHPRTTANAVMKP